MSQIRISSLTDLFAAEFSKRLAIVIPQTGLTLTYRHLEEKIEALKKSMLEAGVRSGDVAVMVLPNGAEFLTTFLALAAAGAIALPVNPACTIEELRFVLADSAARFVFGQPANQVAKQAAAVSGAQFGEVYIDRDITVRVDFTNTMTSSMKSEPGELLDVAMILYTSGTTSNPKAVPLTHRNIAASIHYFSDAFELSPDDATLVVMPPFHVHGLIGATLSTLYTGGTAVLTPRFSASQFWQDASKYKVTWYSASPTIHQILLKRAEEDGAPVSGLRFVRSSSAKLAPAVLSQFETRFGTTMIEAYGMTEASNQISANPLPPRERKAGSAGLPAGTEISILDEHNEATPTGQVGEICIRGAAVLKGYRNNQNANATSFVNGWFRTGDQGYLDHDGYLYVSGRIKDLINRGGEKISPIEIETVLLKHPSVLDAVCFGVPDEKYGEEVQAAIVLRDDTNTQDILQFCRNQLVEFKVPKKLHLAEELPRTATNKIQRNMVADCFTKRT